MATAYLNLVTLVTTAIIPSVNTASVWGTLAPKYQVAPVCTDKLVDLECPAFMDLTKVTTTMPLA